MTKYSKFNVIYRLQKWMDSVPGQTFLNYAYSWGASVVILGTLFKLTHLPGANFWLFLGMGTEVFVFFLSAFDRPFDKTAIGMDLPTHLDEDKDKEEEEVAGTVNMGTTVIGGVPASGATIEGGSAVGGTIIIGGNMGAGSLEEQQQASNELADAQSNYVEELKKLTETLQKVAEQSERLTRDSEEMENLNRTLTGICKVYEMQLKGASQQIGTIDQINDQSRRMAQQIEQLNSIYARMIEAMTVNMNLKVKE
jgi:gliding motility-associated protein GldL